MVSDVEKSLRRVYRMLSEAEKYGHACRVLNYDEETICPKDGMAEQGELIAFLENQAFVLEKDPEYREAAENLYEHRDELGEYDRVLAESLHRDYERSKNVSAEKDAAFRKVYRQAFVDWLEAKEKADYRIFEPSLRKVRDVQLEEIALSERKFADPYDSLLDQYERGVTSQDLDEAFGRCKERLVPFLEKIRKSGKRIRTDFLSRRVTDEAQRRMAEWLLSVMNFDRNRGAITTTEHPFTDGMGRNDIRITTHYHPDQFLSSIFTVMHESGHALFEMLQPQENYDHFINGNKTMGMHESVSRFYENRIGRSESFLSILYPKAKEIFPDVLSDVSEKEFCEAVNLVRPSFIRTEADEFTYPIHIIIRYEIEKEILSGKADLERLPEVWNRKYRDYLGITPPDDRAGILQDVHWASGFGYFPAYALGDMYNAMYFNRMKKELDIDREIRSGSFININAWMQEHVFKKADRQDPKTWIREITGREFTPEDFLDYLEEKYGVLYGLD